jgi:hypothetical protein
MQAILVIRKGDTKKARKALTKAQRKAVADALAVARVQRPALLDFFLSGEFGAMVAVPQSVIDNPLRRANDYPDSGFIVPEDSLGRAPKKGERDYASTAQSILLWIKKYLVDTGAFSVDEISVIVIDV